MNPTTALRLVNAPSVKIISHATIEADEAKHVSSVHFSLLMVNVSEAAASGKETMGHTPTVYSEVR